MYVSVHMHLSRLEWHVPDRVLDCSTHDIGGALFAIIKRILVGDTPPPEMRGAFIFCRLVGLGSLIHINRPRFNSDLLITRCMFRANLFSRPCMHALLEMDSVYRLNHFTEG